MIPTGEPTPPSRSDYVRAAVQLLVSALPPEALKEAARRLTEIWQFHQPKPTDKKE